MMRTPVGNELRVLKLLASHPRLNGIELHRLDVSLNPSQLYVILSRMEKNGIISGGVRIRQPGISGQGVRNYKITNKGKARWEQAVNFAKFILSIDPPNKET
jgi:DNA-binding PadR family transcriptional regulator